MNNSINNNNLSNTINNNNFSNNLFNTVQNQNNNLANSQDINVDLNEYVRDGLISRGLHVGRTQFPKVLD